MTTDNDPQTHHRNDRVAGGNAPTPGTAADAPKDPAPASDPVAEENDYSPDFKPEPLEPKPETDADIDTQGG